MTWADFRKIINTLGYPSAYGLFNTAQSPPYFLYGIEDRSDLMADNIHFLEITDGYLELYTSYPEFEISKQVEKLLTDNNIPWGFENEARIEDEKVWYRRWGFSFIGG